MLRRFFITNNKGDGNRLADWPDSVPEGLHHRMMLAIRMPVPDNFITPAASASHAC
ncbi:hypothetical protein PAMC26577_02710 [Caballeronia sordidicola]|uniref:Uncharacterized protein n=1 Tax=Caballeronia sordidicola TaxID=196367 RepID=A0A242N5T4_CABSO|nr:hypothetical protein PAMC26577_02710 [Caballeronia sordidicola]